MFDLSHTTMHEEVPSGTVDVVTMLFVLSAMSPPTMPTAIDNVFKVS